MTLRVAYTVFALVVGLLLSIAFLGCTDSSPTGPTVNVEGNNGPVTIVVPSGDASSGSTAPCGSATTSQTGSNSPTATGPNCSTQANGNGASAPEPVAVIP